MAFISRHFQRKKTKCCNFGMKPRKNRMKSRKIRMHWQSILAGLLIKYSSATFAASINQTVKVNNKKLA